MCVCAHVSSYHFRQYKHDTILTHHTYTTRGVKAITYPPRHHSNALHTLHDKVNAIPYNVPAEITDYPNTLHTLHITYPPKSQRPSSVSRPIPCTWFKAYTVKAPLSSVPPPARPLKSPPLTSLCVTVPLRELVIVRPEAAAKRAPYLHTKKGEGRGEGEGVGEGWWGRRKEEGTCGCKKGWGVGKHREG